MVGGAHRSSSELLVALGMAFPGCSLGDVRKSSSKPKSSFCSKPLSYWRPKFPFTVFAGKGGFEGVPLPPNWELRLILLPRFAFPSLMIEPVSLALCAFRVSPWSSLMSARIEAITLSWLCTMPIPLETKFFLNVLIFFPKSTGVAGLLLYAFYC